MNEAKQKKIDYKQFKLGYKTDEESKLNGETKKNLRRLKIEKYFSYDPTALVNKLLSQNTQDLRKRLDEIKQQKIELKKDERNSTNNKNENDRLNMILSVIDKIYKFFEYNFLQGEQSDELKLLKWVKVSKNWFDMIKKCNKVQNA